MFKVEPYMLDENNYLRDIVDIAEDNTKESEELYNAYCEIEEMFEEIFTDDIDIF